MLSCTYVSAKSRNILNNALKSLSVLLHFALYGINIYFIITCIAHSSAYLFIYGNSQFYSI